MLLENYKKLIETYRQPDNANVKDSYSEDTKILLTFIKKSVGNIVAGILILEELEIKETSKGTIEEQKKDIIQKINFLLSSINDPIIKYQIIQEQIFDNDILLLDKLYKENVQNKTLN